MEDDENMPILECMKTLNNEFSNLQRIKIDSDNFTIGRGLKNSVVIPFLSISRNHCVFKKIEDDWLLEDNSSFGIKINNVPIGKGKSRNVSHEDIICLELSQEFVYKFIQPSSNMFQTSRKRIKRENDECDLKDVRLMFEESQNFEIKHIEEKLFNMKQLQNSSIIMKQQLQQDMDRKMEQVKRDCASQIENLTGEKNEVEKQKAILIEERNAQLAQVKNEMEGKIAELKEQIEKHNETETELMKENSSLKEKLEKEREEFLSELSRETSSKQDMLEKLEAKIKEQEEVRLKEKQEFEDMLKRETEQLRLTKEKELKELEELKLQREHELQQELNDIKKNLTDQMEQTEQQRRNAEEQLNLQKEQLKKLTDEEKVKMEQMLKEREEIQNKLKEAQLKAETSLQDLQKRVRERETELAALAAERIQVQADQSSVVISNLQEQLEQVKNQLQSVETEKNTLLESIFSTEDTGEGTSKQNALNEVGELMESELQCSICAELFIEAVTLSCSHTFCKYCISMWKKNKKDCPICRAPITSECRSLVLDSFIDRMVQNLTQEMKEKREEVLKYRAELVSEMARQAVGTSRGSFMVESEDSEDFEYDSEAEEEEYFDSHYDYWPYRRRRYYDYDDDDDDEDDESIDTDGGSDDGSDTDQPDGAASHPTAAGDDPSAAVTASDETGVPAASTVSNTGSNSGNSGRGRRRGRVAGLPGAYYGGYGRCFRCGGRGHWAPGCPLR